MWGSRLRLSVERSSTNFSLMIVKMPLPRLPRRSKIRLMRARPWKDAASWHKSGVKNRADRSLPF
jgi:hypothetical protein